MRISLHHTVGAAVAVLVILAASAAQAQPGVGADQLVLRDPTTGNVFILRAPSTAGAPANYVLELPNMAGVPSVAGVLLTIDNSGGPTKRMGVIPPTANSVLITQSGAPLYSTTLPSGLTIPGAAITGSTINNTQIGNTTPSTGAFTNLSTTGTSTFGNGSGVDNFTVNAGTGTVSFSGARVQNVATPTAGTDAANKAYVDSVLNAPSGNTVLSYGSGSQDTIPSNVTVWQVVNGGSGNVVLPTAPVNGQILYVYFNTSSAGSLGGTNAPPGSHFIYIYAGGWQLFSRQN